MALRPNPTWISRLGRYGIVVLLMGGALLAGIAYGIRHGEAQARASVSGEAAALLRNASALAEANNQLAAQKQQLQITESARAALASDLADAQQDLARSRESLAFF